MDGTSTATNQVAAPRLGFGLRPRLRPIRVRHATGRVGVSRPIVVASFRVPTSAFLWLPTVGLALAAALGGCALDSTPSATVAPTAAPTSPAIDAELTQRLRGPWSPVPITLPPDVVAIVDRACRAERREHGRLELVVVDARGEGLVHVFYVADGEFSTTNCLDMEVNPFGEIEALGFGNSDPTPLPSPGEHDLIVWHQTREEAPRSIYHIAGLAGPRIATVRLTADGKVPIVASLANGWFAAWILGEDYPRITIRGYDATGSEVDAIQP